MFLEINSNGLYCAQADVYIDPWRPVRKALITHGHSDHMRRGHRSYLCHRDTVPVLLVRIGSDVEYQSVAYGEITVVNGVKISFHPAGHILGSAQIRLEYGGEIWVVTGDYKLHSDGLSPEFESIRCHHLITESTFGLPIYQFQSPLVLIDEIQSWWQINQQQNFNTVVFCYSLGKAQAILNQFREVDAPIYLHGAIANLNEALAQNGYCFPGTRVTGSLKKESVQGALILAPPAVLGSPWMRQFGAYQTAMCSGWMQLRGARRRRGVDRGFVYSDHCDFDSLNTAVQLCGAENIYITHGYETQYASWLRQAYGLNAQILKTLYNDVDTDEL